LYVVAIAESGQGKDNSRIYLPNLLKAAELEQFSGPETFRSENGLLIELQQQPAFVANVDEFGKYMGAISDPKAATYYKNIGTLLTALFGKSRTFYKDGLTASRPDDRIVLQEPHLCIYGTTTSGTFTESMRKSSIDSGQINRFIVFQTPIRFPEDQDAACHSDPPEALVLRWKQFKVEGLEAAPAIIEQTKTIVMIGDMEPELKKLQVYQREMHQKYDAQGIGELWVRYRENVIKIAMIIAIARDRVKPMLTLSDIETGKQIAHQGVEFMIKFASENMYDGEFQKKCAKFLEALDAGCDTRTKMIRRMGLKDKELDEIERTLKEMEKIDYNMKDRPRKYTIK